MAEGGGKKKKEVNAVDFNEMWCDRIKRERQAAEEWQSRLATFALL